MELLPFRPDERQAEVLAHPGVVECACVGVRSEHAHDDDPVPDQDVKVFVVPAPGGVLDPHELFDFLVPRMPAFMLPRYIEVVDALPKTPTNKVRKVELRAEGITAGTWDCEAAGIRIRRDRLIESGPRS